jgi:hypothetical protein
MAEEQMRPASPQQAPDPSHSYERSHPGREAGMGRLDSDKAVPSDAPDQHRDAAANPQDPSRHVSAQDAVNQRGGPAPVQPDHSMLDEEPDGWDQAPTDIHDPQQKRHPRKEGKGGTP